MSNVSMNDCVETVVNMMNYVQSLEDSMIALSDNEDGTIE